MPKYGFFGEDLPRSLIHTVFETALKDARLSPDNIAKIGAAVIGSKNGVPAFVVRHNGIPDGVTVPKEIWDKKDIAIEELVKLNKRDFVLHAEERAVMAALAAMDTLDIGIVTAFPCPRCFMFLKEAGINTVIFGDTEITSSNAKKTKTIFLSDNSKNNVQFLHISEV
jgi:deoxycytidylate deaminase